ncbi:toll-like receptor Tollo [Rhipicephalus sanguineus]|uniref:toll-like receptor Tollo n=1 Tax=Rhipicephalus sanguineus TaxID=34632 RepID=UPI0018961A3D|nr:toll-like receptor Tollo [Rhipicephalus sanguineus]
MPLFTSFECEESKGNRALFVRGEYDQNKCLLTVLLAVSAAYLRYKDFLRTWLRGHGVSGLEWCVADNDTEKLFDVFVSFSSKDVEWIHDEIVPGLEAMDFSYCTYERNFKGGYLLQDIIRDAVSCSRRSLLVLTENFLASEWCRFEFRLAHQRALRDNINRLVIVLVDEIDPGELDEDLRLYVRSANYLRWGEPNFWDRLVYSLDTKEAQRKLIVKRGPVHITSNATDDIELN